MPVAYSVDVLRHWSCKCSEGEALAFRSHLAMSGLDLPLVDTSWAIVDGEPEVAGSDVAAWQHVVSACVKASNDGMSERGLAEYAAVLDDLATVVNVLNVREGNGWAELIAGFVPEVAAEASAPESHAPPEPAPIPPMEVAVEQVSAPPSDSVNVGEVTEQAPTPAVEPTQPSEASE